MKALTLTKFVDLASPGLFLWCCNGKHIKLAELTVRRAGTTPVEYLKIILEDVVVGGISTGVSRADDRPTEEVVLYFGKVRYEYVPVRPDGKAGGRVNVGWSLEENRAL
jgi:type VI secretion system secreted protein Hcp